MSTDYWMWQELDEAARLWDETPEHLKPIIVAPYWPARKDAE